MKEKLYKDKNLLYQKYCVERLSGEKISELLNCSSWAVYFWIRKFGIKVRTMVESHKGLENSGQFKKGHVPFNIGCHTYLSKESREKMSLAKIGEKSPRWKGGRKLDANGYVYILKKNHPKATPDGYVGEHRLIVEESLGRYLNPNEIPHHKNGIPWDNRRENLDICNSSEHTVLHLDIHKYLEF